MRKHPPYLPQLPQKLQQNTLSNLKLAHILRKRLCLTAASSDPSHNTPSIHAHWSPLNISEFDAKKSLHFCPTLMIYILFFCWWISKTSFLFYFIKKLRWWPQGFSYYSRMYFLAWFIASRPISQMSISHYVFMHFAESPQKLSPSKSGCIIPH